MRGSIPAARLGVVMVLVLLVTVATACATWGGQPPDGEQPSPHLRANVENNSTRDVMVHVAAGGIEWRLGAVKAGASRSFHLPGRVTTVDSYYLVADPIGTWDRVVSEPITASTVFRPYFEVGASSNASYVRCLRTRAPAAQGGKGHAN